MVDGVVDEGAPRARVLAVEAVVVGLVAIGIALLVIFGHDNATATAFHTSAATACRSRPASTLIQPGFDA